MIPFRARAHLPAGALILLLAALAGCDASAEAGTAQAPRSAGSETVARTAPAAEAPTVTVYKTPTCGCCTKWVEHMQANGYRVDVKDMDDVTPIKDQHGVPTSMRSCHTALVGGYAVEGHVPADVVAKLLKERPKVAGIAVPGMPMGSPGMEGSHSESHDVLTFDGDKTTVYAKR